MSQNPPPSGNAPTEPLHTPTVPLAPNQRPAGAGGQIPRWQGHAQRVPAYGHRPAPRQRRVFSDQQPGERVYFVRRQHIVFLLIPLWPVVLAAVALALLQLPHSPNARLDALFFLLRVGFWAMLVIGLLKWLAVDLIGWFYNVYILTDRRLVDMQGFIFQLRKEAPLDRIQQVQIDRNNVFEYLFGFGNVVIVTAGTHGDLTFDRVAGPNEMADQIRVAEQAYRRGIHTAAPIEPEHPAIKRVLDQVAQPIAPPAPPGVPHRTFGGFLHRPAMIRFFDDEVVMDYIYRHIWVLIRRELIPAAIVVGGLAAAVVLFALGSMFWMLGVLGIVGGAIYGGLVYLNYADDVFILTTHRVIDIDRFVFIFFEGRKQADYSRVQDVRVTITSLVGRVLNFGNILVETAGRLPNIEMTDIPNPFSVQDKIAARINAAKEREAIAAANRQRQENRRLIAATMNEVLVKVPNVDRLPMLEAGERIHRAGLRWTIEAERRMPGVPPGVVIAQIPSPGATALVDSEVYVTLSGR